jgi:hypothetical protein
LLKETGYRRTIFRAAAVLATGCGDPVQLGFGVTPHSAAVRRAELRSLLSALPTTSDQTNYRKLPVNLFLAMMDNAHDDITDQEISQYDQPLANVRLAASIGRLEIP